MIKKIASTLALSFVIVTPASAFSLAPISYAIIDKVSTSSITVSVAEIISRKTYTCIPSTLACEFSTSTPIILTKEPVRLISRASSTEKYLDFKQPAVKLIPPPSGLFQEIEIPKEARYKTLSPNGEMTAFWSHQGPVYPFSNSRTFWVMSTSTKRVASTIEVVPGGYDMIGENNNIMAWSPDGRSLFLLSDRSGYSSLYRWKADSLGVTPELSLEHLTPGNYSVIDIATATDTVYFIANRKNEYTWGLFSYDVLKKKIHTIDAYVMYTNNLAVVDNTLVYTRNVHGEGRLMGYSIAKREALPFRGIESHPVLVGKYELISKPFKGIMLPPKKKGKEAIIWLHGGPMRQSSPERQSYGSYALYDWMLEEARANGVAVLKLDYAGSFGFGTKLASRLVGNIGKEDVSDLRKAVGYLKGRGYTKITLAGVSYGGYLTLKGIDAMPGTFSNAISIAPVTNWKSLLENYSPTPFQLHFPGSYENQLKMHMIADTLTQTNIQKTPLVLVYGDRDDMVPFVQSLEYAARVAVNTPLVFASLPGEKHVLRNPAAINAVCEMFAGAVGRPLNCNLDELVAIRN